MTGDDDQTTAEEWAKNEGLIYIVVLGADVETIDILLKKLYQNAVTLIGNVQGVDTTKDKTPILEMSCCQCTASHSNPW